jgi:hypothetical protein
MYHLADSYLNGFVVMKLVLTQISKTIVLLAKCKAAHRGILQRGFSPVGCPMRSEHSRDNDYSHAIIPRLSAKLLTIDFRICRTPQ